MRKTLMSLVALLILVSMSATIMAQEESEGWTCPEGFEGQTLRIFNWSTYVAEDTIPNFEELCGVTVEYSIYESNEAMLTIVREGGAQYDIAVPSDYAVDQMIAEELLLPIDHEAIPNLANVAEEFLDPPFDEGNVYSVPYQWGTVGIGYDTTVIEEMTTWEEFFNYDGPVAWLDDPRAIIGIALTILDYDPNSTDPDEIEEAKQFLMDHSDNVVAIAVDDGQAMLERGDIDAVIEYSGDIFQIMAESEDFAYVIPAEGTTIWTDNLVILKDAPNPELANVFIDYILDPQVGADLSNYIAYGTPNQASLDAALIDEEMLSDPGIYPDEDTLERLFWVEAVGEDEQLYGEAWTEILASMGQ